MHRQSYTHQNGHKMAVEGLTEINAKSFEAWAEREGYTRDADEKDDK